MNSPHRSQKVTPLRKCAPGMAGSEVELNVGWDRRKTVLGQCGQCCSRSHKTGASLRTTTDGMCPDTRIANTGGELSMGSADQVCLRKAAIANSIITTLWVQLRQGATLRWTLVLIGVWNLPRNLYQHRYLAGLPCFSSMTDKSKQQKRRDGAIPSLDVAISLVSIGKEASSMTPAPAVFGVVTILLTTIRVSFIPLSERDIRGSKIVRTRWPTNRIVWISGYSAPISVMCSGGEQMGREQTSSASRCAMR